MFSVLYFPIKNNILCKILIIQRINFMFKKAWLLSEGLVPWLLIYVGLSTLTVHS